MPRRPRIQLAGMPQHLVQLVAKLHQAQLVLGPVAIPLFFFSLHTLMSVIFGKPKVNIVINCLQELSAKFASGRKDVGNDQGKAGGLLLGRLKAMRLYTSLI